MKVKLLQATPFAEAFLGQVAGICYGADTSDPERNLRRAKHCAEKGHLAVLRFAHATFEISDISRVCSHQLVRSKHLDVLQQSQRYCAEDTGRDWPYDYPPSVNSEEAKIVFDAAVYTANQDYQTLLNLGVKKEDARFVLPEFTRTALNVTGNYQAWRDFIKLRNTKEAQFEIRQVAQEVERLLHEVAPNLFGVEHD